MTKPALQAFVEAVAGGSFYTQVTSVSLTTSPTRIVQNNFERMGLLIINTGGNNCHINPDNTVSTTKGVALGASGGSASLNARDDLVLVGWDWWGVSDTSTTTVTVIEIIRFNIMGTPANPGATIVPA